MKRMLATCTILLASAGLGPAEEPASAELADQPAVGADACQPGPRLWGRADYLFWWIKDSPVPVPLVTTGPITPNLAPVLGQPGTVLLIGAQDVDNEVRSGGRFLAGCWLDPDGTLGLEGGYFFLGERAVRQLVASDAQPGSPFLALPFFNVAPPGESSTRIALPGGFAGAAQLTLSSFLQGAEGNAAWRLGRGLAGSATLLGGFRYLNLHERLDFATNSPSIVPPPDIFRTLDQFDTANNFFGGQLGVRGEIRRGSLSLEALAKVALGAMHQSVQIDGVLVTSDFSGVIEAFPAGYFALPTNIGRQSRDRFAVVPEVDVRLGYQVTSFARLSVGYSFLYLSDVARPGEQIDRGLNPSQAPGITGIPSTTVIGPPRPTPLFNSSDFWAQGVSFGLELRY